MLHFQSWWVAWHGCAALHPSCRCCLCCVVSSGHFIFHQCHCSDAKSCQTTPKWLFSPYGAYVICSVEQTHTPAPGFTDVTHGPLFHTLWGFYFRCEVKVTSSPRHLTQSLDQHVVTFLCHINELDLFLKLGNRQFYFIEMTLGQMTFTSMRVAQSSFRYAAGVGHRKLRGHIKLPDITFPKCQLFSA